MVTSPSSSLRILIVEDMPDCAESFAMLLRCKGHCAIVAKDGPVALSAVRAEKPDVVLLDLGLPGMNGYEVARELRREFGLATPLLIAVTGYGQHADRRRSAECGIDIHLLKPIELSKLNSILDGIKRPSDAAPL